jgi:HK97 family phage prohead protease
VRQTLKPAGAPELRRALTPLRNIQWRDAGETGDGSYTLTGHAAVYEQETVLLDVGWWRLREVVARGAFTGVLSRRPDVHLVLGHDMTRAIARTGVHGIGGLELSEDEVGLRVFARLDPVDPDVVSLAAKMNRGVVDQMSFAFTIGEAKYDLEIDRDGNEDELRTILEVADLFDVSVVAQGAYAQTDAALRGRLRLDRSLRRRAQKRADVESVGVLADMYELGQQFLDDETEPADEEDRAAMQEILGQLETLIEAEAGEEEPAGEEEGRQPSAGATRTRRAGSPAGAETVAPAEPAGGVPTRSRRAEEIRQKRAAAPTHLLKENR